MPLRRLTVAALSAAAVLSAAPAAGALPLPVPAPVPLPAPAPSGPPAGEDRLTVTVHDSGNRAADGTYTLDCHPQGGTHRSARDACERLDEVTRFGRDPFAPVDREANCTMIYGGPATARLTGTWAGRPVDARFSRANGCEISRWDHLLPVLPELAG